VNVPAEARVMLAGVATRQTGETREFSTTQLAPGQSWNNYKVSVEFDVDGKTVTKQATISLVGGETKQLSFSFDADSEQLALNN
jgi:uncharacterized protein (TIGR03000 family)